MLRLGICGTGHHDGGRRLRTWGSALLALAVMPLTVLAPVGVPRAQAATTELFFSEYIEGSSNNKALEIYNGTGAAVDLGAAGYNVQMFFNGSAVCTLDDQPRRHRCRRRRVRARAGVSQRHDPRPGRPDERRRAGSTATMLSCSARARPSSTSSARSASTPARSGAPGSPVPPTTRCIGRRRSARATPTAPTPFDPAVEWDGFATDTFGGLGAHTANCGGVDVAPAVQTTTSGQRCDRRRRDAEHRCHVQRAGERQRIAGSRSRARPAARTPRPSAADRRASR